MVLVAQIGLAVASDREGKVLMNGVLGGMDWQWC